MRKEKEKKRRKKRKDERTRKGSGEARFPPPLWRHGPAHTESGVPLAVVRPPANQRSLPVCRRRPGDQGLGRPLETEPKQTKNEPQNKRKTPKHTFSLVHLVSCISKGEYQMGRGSKKKRSNGLFFFGLFFSWRTKKKQNNNGRGVTTFQDPRVPVVRNGVMPRIQFRQTAYEHR